jgi:hypothetical protein
MYARLLILPAPVLPILIVPKLPSGLAEPAVPIDATETVVVLLMVLPSIVTAPVKVLPRARHTPRSTPAVFARSS